MTDYVVATIKPWNIDAFHQHTPSLPGSWHLIDRPEDLELDRLAEMQPRYMFFPHWSWKVPPEILQATECVCFHMTDLPYGRGGSPLQNLIARGHDVTKLTALRMVEELDAGPIYTQTTLDLSDRAQDIYERAAELVYALIFDIVSNEPIPEPQHGKGVIFPRRKPEQSALPTAGALESLYDHIRMLDAETYPSAYLDHGEFRIEFHHACPTDDGVSAQVQIRRRYKKQENPE